VKAFRIFINLMVCGIWGALTFGVVSCAVERHVANAHAQRQVDDYNRSIAEMERIIVRERQILQAEKK